jgi:hypothetical protein
MTTSSITTPPVRALTDDGAVDLRDREAERYFLRFLGSEWASAAQRFSPPGQNGR